MTDILEFEAQFMKALPETAELLRRACFAVHPGVTMVTLHGSRGLAGGARPDSDVDLSLIVDPGGATPERSSLKALLRDVLTTTLDRWKGAVEADLAPLAGESSLISRVEAVPEQATGR